MRKIKNDVVVEGRVYDKSNLAIKTVTSADSKKFGQEYIGGSIDVATDDEGLNVITVYFTFIQPTYSSGKTNSTYGVLKNIIENGKTVLEDGADAATLVRITGAVGLNDYYSQRDNEEVLVSTKRCIGSFANIVPKLKDESERNTFECDMLINGTQLVSADEERNIAEDYLIVKGATFDFRGAMLPVEFIVKSQGGIQYFESLEVSSKNLVFTKVWGQIHSETVVTKKEIESAFGDSAVKEYKKTVREWIITGTAKPDNVYEIGDAEKGITEDEIKKAISDREIYLAEKKKADEDYRAKKNGGATAAAPAAQGGFAF